jgi:hypothetical protein
MLALLQPTSIRQPTDQRCGKPRDCGKLSGETEVSVIAFFLDHLEYGDEMVGFDGSNPITNERPISGAPDKLNPNSEFTLKSAQTFGEDWTSGANCSFSPQSPIVAK